MQIKLPRRSISNNDAQLIAGQKFQILLILAFLPFMLIGIVDVIPSLLSLINNTEQRPVSILLSILLYVVVLPVFIYLFRSTSRKDLSRLLKLVTAVRSKRRLVFNIGLTISALALFVLWGASSMHLLRNLWIVGGALAAWWLFLAALAFVWIPDESPTLKTAPSVTVIFLLVLYSSLIIHLGVPRIEKEFARLTPSSTLIITFTPTPIPISQTTSVPYSPPYPPSQDFEVRFANYSEAERQIVLHHMEMALSNLPENATEFDKTAAINDYLYQYFHGSKIPGNGGADFLTKGGTQCGGFVATMAEMLYAVGIHSKLAAVYGGLMSHSLIEVFFGDGSRGLFDPTYGAFYYDSATHQPVSLEQIANGADVSRIIYLTTNPRRDTPEQIIPISDVFSVYKNEDTQNRAGGDNYISAFKRLFEAADGAVVSNQGHASFVEIDLRTGQLIGDKDWDPKTDGAVPWLSLALWKREDGRDLSWAYEMGQMMGYDVNHIYHLDGLEPGKTYILRHYIAAAYSPDGSDLAGPAISIQQVDPYRPAQYADIERYSSSLDPFVPYLYDFVFEAPAEKVSFIYHVSGRILITAIELVPK